MWLQKAVLSNCQRRITHFIPNWNSLHHAKSKLVPPSQNHFLVNRTFRTNLNLQKPTKLDTGSLQELVTYGPIPPGNVFKALVFTGAFSIGTFMGATILEYENTRNMMIEKARQSKLNWLQRRPNAANNYWNNLKTDLKQLWHQLGPGEQVFAPIFALNLLVFGLWRVPRFRQVMTTYFCSNPVGKVVCWPMFLSTFSHYSTVHIFANMYVLHSFSNAAVLSLGKEQFLAVYLSGGVIASLASIVYKAARSQAGLSIGASGAIMAILAYVCTQYPDTKLSILFLPTLVFSASSAIKVIMSIDLIGCVMGWKFFDHAAHLGGALFGLFYAYFGHEVWQKRLPFLTMYHNFRKTK